ncbi:hypothetical protein Plhal703r1_c01g0005491 [Plasmopara halstedii]
MYLSLAGATCLLDLALSRAPPPARQTIPNSQPTNNSLHLRALKSTRHRRAFLSVARFLKSQASARKSKMYSRRWWTTIIWSDASFSPPCIIISYALASLTSHVSVISYSSLRGMT